MTGARSMTPDPTTPIVLLTDYEHPSYVIIGRLFRLTLESAGFTVMEKPADAIAGGSVANGQWVLSNTIGPMFNPVPGAVNVALPAHEWSRYPADWVEKLNRFDEIWVASGHEREVLSNSGVTTPVELMAPGLDFDPVPLKNDWDSGGPFRFLSCGAGHFRKGFHLLMEGFIRAFPEPGSASLTIKTSADVSWSTPREDIIIDTRTLERRDMLSLYSGYDAYVTASLGEGLGLPVAEAVLACLPVLANYWGGHRSLLDQGAFWEIPYEEVDQPFCSEPSYFATNQKCAFSSPSAIAETLRMVVENSADKRESMARSARDFLLARYGKDVAIKRFVQYLKPDK